MPTANRETFAEHSRKADGRLLDHGPIRAVSAKDDETICFSFIEWPDRATRDAAMSKLQGGDTDECLDPARNPMPFDGKRMIFRGFTAIYDQSN